MTYWTRTRHHHPKQPKKMFSFCILFKVNIPNRKSNLFPSMKFRLFVSQILCFPLLKCTSDKQFHFLWANVDEFCMFFGHILLSCILEDFTTFE